MNQLQGHQLVTEASEQSSGRKPSEREVILSPGEGAASPPGVDGESREVTAPPSVAGAW